MNVCNYVQSCLSSSHSGSSRLTDHSDNNSMQITKNKHFFFFSRHVLGQARISLAYFSDPNFPIVLTGKAERITSIFYGGRHSETEPGPGVGPSPMDVQYAHVVATG